MFLHPEDSLVKSRGRARMDVAILHLYVNPHPHPNEATHLALSGTPNRRAATATKSNAMMQSATCTATFLRPLTRCRSRHTRSPSLEFPEPLIHPKHIFTSPLITGIRDDRLDAVARRLLPEPPAGVLGISHHGPTTVLTRPRVASTVLSMSIQLEI